MAACKQSGQSASSLMLFRSKILTNTGRELITQQKLSFLFLSASSCIDLCTLHSPLSSPPIAFLPAVFLFHPHIITFPKTTQSPWLLVRRAEQAQLSQQAQHPQRTQLLQVQLEKAVQARLHAIEECNASKERARVELEHLREKYRVEIKAPKFIRPCAHPQTDEFLLWYHQHRANHASTPTTEETFDRCQKPTQLRLKPKGPSIFSNQKALHIIIHTPKDFHWDRRSIIGRCSANFLNLESKGWA